jgi:simple sugar transport system ATP-binding protein
LVETLSVGQKQRLEVVKALAGNARILLMDEPTAALAPPEIEELIRAVREFAAAGGAVVLITHKLDEALAAADRVTVLRQGRVTLDGPVGGETRESLAAAMIGGEAEGRRGGTVPGGEAERRRSGTVPGGEAERRRGGETPPTIGGLSGVTIPPIGGRGPGLRDASLTIHSGELLGVAAVEGNGQRELLLALAGLLEPSAGAITRPAPVALVPEDRTTEGLIPEFTLTENVTLGLLDRADWIRGRWLDWSFARHATGRLLLEHDVRATGPDALAAALSGGNQQKLVLARALARRPHLLVVENATRGLDIRATEEVLARLRAATRDGVAVVMHSADLDELLEWCDRLVVVHQGALREFLRPFDRTLIGQAMLGVVGGHR